MKRKLIINVGTDIVLGNLVDSLLANLEIPHTRSSALEYDQPAAFRITGDDNGYGWDRMASYRRGDFFLNDGYQFLDAATQMGEIINLLKNTITVKLNDAYTAIVSKDRKTAKVGCQTFTREAVTELYNAMKEEA